MRTLGLVLGLLLAAAANAFAKEDGRSDRLRIKGDTILRGSTARSVLAVQQTGLCKPGLTDEELIKTFIRVSEVGGTALCFDLQGFNPDGTVVDPKDLETALKLKDAANYRWMPTVIHVLGSLEQADDATRLNAVRTVAKAFQDVWSVLYWIDGPKSEALAEELHKQAPKLLVLSGSEGDVQLVTDTKDAAKDKAALLLGALPPKDGPVKNCILPDAPASDRKSTRLNSSHIQKSRMPSSA